MPDPKRGGARRAPGLFLPREAAAPSFALLLFLIQGACAPRGAEVAFAVDLGRSSEGEVGVRMRIRNPGPGPLIVSSFAQPDALRVGRFRAHFGGREIPATSSADARGFLTWSLSPAPGTDPIHVEYVARPGAVEMARMAGPTGFKMGHLDGRYGLFGARQIFLLPTTPRLPGRITVRLLLPPQQEIVTTWRGPRDRLDVSFEDGVPARDLLDAVIAVGRFESRRSPSRVFEVFVLSSLPEGVRQDAARRALALEQHLHAALGGPSRPYRLILVPGTRDGFSIPALSSSGGLGLSLGPGLPTRWLTIGRAIGLAYLAEPLAAMPAEHPGRRLLQALPTYATARFSERDGWRPQREWMEHFYYETVDVDLRDPGGDVETTRLEWRTVVALDLLSRELERQGRGPLEGIAARALRQDRASGWRRFVDTEIPPDVRARLDRWLAPDPGSFPFPGADEADPPLMLRRPPPLPPAGRGSRRFDLYLGARNLGVLEQCGCKKEQLGGMARRATVLRRRLAGGTPALALELGDAVPWDHHSPVLDPQKIAESDLVLSLMAGSGVRATIVGHAEVSYGPEFLAERLARLPPGIKMLSANVSGQGLAPPPLLELAGMRPRITIVGAMAPSAYDLGRAQEFEDAVARMSIAPPAEALAAVLSDPARTGLTVVAGPLGPREVMEIHAAVPGVRLILTSNYFRFLRHPSLEFERPLDLATFGMLDGTLLVLLKSDAKGLVRLGLALDADGGIVGAELEGIPLNDSIPDDPSVRRRLDQHYDRLAAAAGLPDLPPMGEPLRLKLQADYVGSANCAGCHPDETEQWRGTAHATAFATLLERHRQGVPGCYACHVTGYGQPAGYRSIADVRLRHVQCESCHGPGGRHLAAPAAGSIVRTPPSAVCRECHTQDHSDMTDANFAGYWARIVHAGGTGAARREETRSQAPPLSAASPP